MNESRRTFWRSIVKEVLVTGGAGFIGSNFVRYLLANDAGLHVVTLDALTYAGSKENLRDLPDPQRHTFIEGNICDPGIVEDVFQSFQIDTVVHFAAETHVDRSILGPAPFIETNIIGAFNLLEVARRFWLEEKGFPECDVRFHHVSTDEVYGSLGPDDPPFTERNPYSPNSPYAASKASSDHLVRAYANTYDLPISITNTSNNYGPYQFPEKFIPLIILNAPQGKRLPIYGDGDQIRDWLYVEDHCEALWRVVREGRVGETYNIGGDNQRTNLVVARMLCRILDEVLPDSPYCPHEELIQFVEDRPGHDRRYAIDSMKLKDELGWQSKESLESGLRKTVEWYLAHPQWVESIRNQPEYRKWLEKNYVMREVSS